MDGVHELGGLADFGPVRTEANDPLHPSRGYYESWLAVLEATLAEEKLLVEPSAGHATEDRA